MSSQPTKALSKVPRLKSGNDVAVVKKLAELITDATDGVRRVLTCGAFIETIVADLQDGQIGDWIEAHGKAFGVGRSSIFAWRKMADEVLTAALSSAGVQKSNALDFKARYELLALPAADLPDELKLVRDCVDEMIQGKSYRQLQMQLKESDATTGGGFNPPEKAVQDFLKKKDPSLAGTKFKKLPKDIQREFKKQFKVTPPAPKEKISALTKKANADLQRVASDLRVYLIQGKSVKRADSKILKTIGELLADAGGVVREEMKLRN